MESNISDERNELQEDDEKLQIALNEFDIEWGDEYYSVEEEEEEDHLLIDLDYQASEQIGQSNTPSFVGSASRSQSLTAADEESGDAVPRPSLALPSHIDVIEHKADPQKTLHLNRILQGILEEHINDIKEALRENREKQEKLQEDASNFSTKPVKKSVYSGSFRAPYFRHVNSYPPSNEDVASKKASGDYEIIMVDSIKDLRQFNKGAKEMLKEAVLENYLEQMLKPTVAKMEFEIQKRDKYTEELNSLTLKLDTETKCLEKMVKGQKDAHIERMIKESKKTVMELKKGIEEKRKIVGEHKQEVDRLEAEIQNRRTIPEDDILKEVDAEKVDWMKIAKQNFGGHSTWLDCQKAWENLVSPAINKKTWTKEDDKKLVATAKATGWNWKEVAKSMGNGRTPFQCFSHYQQYFNTDLKPRPWTDEEDARLVKVTNNVRDSVGFFSWSKVSTLMDSRSPVECMYRFTKIDPSQHRGRWTELEDAKLLAAVEMIGPCWSKISKFINTRNMVQCRERYLNCLAPNINFSYFTYDEDVKLLKLHKNLGPAWAKMVPEFVGRTDNMLLSRYRQLQKWKQQNEWFERQSDSTKRMLLGKSLTIAERRRFESKAFGYIKDQLGIGQEDYKRQELDKQNGVDPDIIPTRPPRHLRCYTAGGGPCKSGSLNKWSVKLDTHKRLTENLHRLLEKEALANNLKKGKPASTLPAQVTEQIMEKTVEETLAGNSQRKKAPRSKIKKLQAALNKVFLTEGTISVQELLKTSLVEKKRSRKTEMNSIIDAELKNVIRRRGRSLSKLGRSRRFFEKDARPASVIEEELDELDHSVPLTLMMSLGTNIRYLCNVAKLQCLTAQEELLTQPSYDEDVDFKAEEAETQAAIQRLSTRTDITDMCRQQRLRVLKRKMKSLRKLYRERGFLNSRIVQNKFNSFHDDLEYLETLVDERKEMEVKKNFLLMACSPLVGLDTGIGAVSSSSSSHSFGNASASCVATHSTSMSSSCSQLAANKASTHSPVSHEGELTKRGEFAVPLVPPRRKRTRFHSNQLSDNPSENESASKRFKGLSKLDIAEERRKLSDVRKSIFTRLPHLPPSLSTLLGLRALFLIKSELIEKAGKLYKPEHYDNNFEVGAETTNEVGAFGGNSAEGDVPLNSGSWFSDTNPQQLTEQARRFEGYGQRRRGPISQSSGHDWRSTLQSQSTENNHVSFENEACVIPLEEKGGCLPDSGSKFNLDCGVEMKPIMTGLKHEPVFTSSDQTDSSYSVVMGYSGEYTSRKGVEKEQSTSIRKATGDSVPVRQKSVSTFPECLIKTDNTFTPVSCYTDVNPVCYTNSCSTDVNPVCYTNSCSTDVNPVCYTNSCSTDVNPASYTNSCSTDVNPASYTNSCSTDVNPASYTNSCSTDVNPVCYTNSCSTDVNPVCYTNSCIDASRSVDNYVPTCGTAQAQGETSDILDIGAISLHHLDQPGEHPGDDDGQVLAVINFHDKDNYSANPSGTVINICSSQPENFSWPNSRQIVILSEDGDASEIYISAQETNQQTELGNLEMSRSRVRHILSNKALKDRKEQIVLVGVDTDSKTIVHFKSEEDTFKAYEAIPLNTDYFNSRNYINLAQSAPSEMPCKPRGIQECMREIRQSDEYQLLLARFKTLFMWPVLMATTRPSPVYNGTVAFTTKQRKVLQKDRQSPEEKHKKNNKRVTAKQSMARRQHLRTIRNVSCKSRSKKTVEHTTDLSSGKLKNDDDSVENEKIGKTHAVSLKQPGETEKVSAGNGQDASRGVVETPATGGDEVAVSKKGRGRPVGSKNRKHQPAVLKERPKRTVKNVIELPQERLEAVKEPVKSLPQWWKDAMLAAMLAKKAMADDGEEDSEVNLEDDNDFIDKGNYSDDEWYQELRQQETKGAT